MNPPTELKSLLLRRKAILAAREDLVAFARFMMPVPDTPDDVNFSLYRPAKHHRVLGAALEKVEKGEYARLQISLPPRHGKTKLASHMFAAWFAGRNPEKSIIVATYSEKFAWDHGRAVRDIIENPLYQQVFPETRLKEGSASMDRLETEQGGVLFFLGRGSGATGRGADVILLDDPTKDRKEADSPTIREQLWSWYTQVLQTRLMTKAGRIVIIQCMTGDTPVLMADGGEKPLRDIRPGDSVATYCEGELSTSVVRNWANQGPDIVFTIKMTSGIQVRANARHPFLVCVNGKPTWIRTSDLRRGHEMLRVNGGNGRAKPARWTAAESRSRFEATAIHTTTRNAGPTVFARLLSITSRSAARISRTATKSVSRITSACSPSRMGNALFVEPTLALSGGNSVLTIATSPAKSADYCVTTAILSSDARTTSDIRKQNKSSWRQSTTSDFMLDTIADVSISGVEDVFDIEVDLTENFIANGLISHNTRWHEDDLIGRLTDPTNPCYSVGEAKKWRVIDMPAIAGDNDVLGRKKGEALWPERFDRDYLDSLRETDIRGFQALYQGRPTPEEGSFFKSVSMRTYKRMADMPGKDRLRFYAASDHAVSVEQGRDKTCCMVIGVDDRDDIWVQPDIFWQQADTATVVENMVQMMAKYQPLFWWAEKGHISKAIGPFLRKRMLEKRVFCTIDELTPVGDKQTRAQSMQARMSMMKVVFPGFTRWWVEAHDQMLKFPQGAHDDFVDTLSMFGLGLYKQRGQRLPPKEDKTPKILTYGWVIEEAKKERKRGRADLVTGGW